MTLNELAIKMGHGYTRDIAIVHNATSEVYEYEVYYNEKLDRWELLIEP